MCVWLEQSHLYNISYILSIEKNAYFENLFQPMPNISHILRDNMFSYKDKIRLLVIYAYQKGGISKGSLSVGLRLRLVER